MSADEVDTGRWVDWGSPKLGMPLTQRELDVFLKVIQLGGQQQAAHELGITIQTVKNHLTSIYARLGVHNQMGALWTLYPTLAEMAEERRTGHERRRGDRRRPQNGARTSNTLKRANT